MQYPKSNDQSAIDNDKPIKVKTTMKRKRPPEPRYPFRFLRFRAPRGRAAPPTPPCVSTLICFFRFLSERMPVQADGRAAGGLEREREREYSCYFVRISCIGAGRIPWPSVLIAAAVRDSRAAFPLSIRTCKILCKRFSPNVNELIGYSDQSQRCSCWSLEVMMDYVD